MSDTTHTTTERPGGRHAASTRGRGRVLIGAIVLILAWLAVGGIGGQSIGKLSGLQQNDNSAFLPADAESTRVAAELTKFQDAQTLPLIIVAERAGGITPADTSAVRELARSIPSITLDELPGEHTVADYLVSPRLAAVPSQDGKAMLVIIPLDLDKASETVEESSPLQATADALQAELDRTLRAQGLTAHVTGPAGFIADLVNAFAGIDGILLLVALGVVLVILLVVYRSPVLPFAVLLTAVFGLSAAGFVVYQVAKAGWITVSGQSQGILSILVVGAATDYALLLVARYKEELHDEESAWQALRNAWRATVEPILASGATVALGLLALTLADLKGTSGLGPVGAIGIAGAVLSALTFLPAVLVLGRRWIFWPSTPRVDHVHRSDSIERGRGWGRVARFVGDHPRRVWVATGVALLAASAFLPTLKADGIATTDIFRTKVDSVTGQKVLERHFDAGSGSPVQVIAPEEDADEVLQILKDDKDLTGAAAGLVPGAPPKVVDGRVVLQATTRTTAEAPEALDVVDTLRVQLHREVGSDVLVGGQTAQNLDVRQTADRDLWVVMPTIIAIVFLVLVLLLRSLLAPLLLVAANVLSFGATMGISALVFNHVFGFPGGDPTTVLYGFVFLVALGVDYSIFLMTRAKEESAQHGTRRGVLIALAVTGGVITSAGIVLAATFGALTVIPLVFLAQISFIVAFGVLLDTLVVRSLLVPALSIDVGDRVWWPRRLNR